MVAPSPPGNRELHHCSKGISSSDAENASDAIVLIIIVIIMILNNNNNNDTNRALSVKPELISITAHWVKKGRKSDWQVRYKLKQRASSVAV